MFHSNPSSRLFRPQRSLSHRTLLAIPWRCCRCDTTLGPHTRGDLLKTVRCASALILVIRRRGCTYLVDEKKTVEGGHKKEVLASPLLQRIISVLL